MAKSIKLENFEAPILILGIISGEKILKLSWVLNKLLKISLSQSHPLKIVADPKVVLEFSLFQCEDENLNLKYSLLENRNGSVHYFSELKNIDHLFFIRGILDICSKNIVIHNLKKSPEITSLLDIDPKNIKSKGKIGIF